jgi:transposase InsO family protein
MENQVQDMLNKAVIEPTSSAWSAPAILVPKKYQDGKPKYRFCVDFRALNAVTQFDTYPLPVFEETVSTLHGSKYFSVIDCYSGFWQIKIADEDKPRTAFSTPSGHYQFQRLPYGLSNSPASFQRLMDIVLRNLSGTECFVFIDVVIIFSDTIEEHTRRLEHVLQRFEKATLQLQPGKCVFAQPQVHYLGYIVSRDGITASPDKVKAVRQYPVPKNAKDVRSFLGLASFYRRLVPKFAELAKPLTELIRKDVQFRWKQRQEAAFEKLKEILCSDRVLAYPDFNAQFILTTDASKVAIAAILSKVQDGVERPIAYASRQLNKAEQNYAVSEVEMLAVTWSTKHFRCYLYGKKFIVRTDHSALTYLHKFAENNSRLMRWSLRLSEFDFDVEHRAGTKIKHVDALSRHVQTVTTERSLTKDQVRAEQKVDKYCNTLEVGKQKGRSEYFYDEEGVIYRRRMNGEHQLVVPKNLIRDVIALNHDPIFAAHPGRKRTLEILCIRYYWPGMRKDVENYVSKCDDCQKRKQRKEYVAPLGEVRQPTYPFEIVGMDICGPFPTTPRKNKYLLTFIDHFTKFAEAIPISDMTAETCARAYATHVIARHGTGSILVTDQGKSFTSVFFRETCRILGVKQINSSAYHPQANGQIERYHKTMNQGLSHYVNASGTNWDTLVPFYLMGYRATPHCSSGYSPYYLLHGREMILPTLQDLKAKLTPEARNTEHASRLEKLKSTLKSAYKLVRENNRRSYVKNKEYYDRRATERNFQKDDVVYLFNPVKKPGQSSKFWSPWTGPWKVTARLSKLNYRIENPQGKECRAC